MITFCRIYMSVPNTHKSIFMSNLIKKWLFLERSNRLCSFRSFSNATNRTSKSVQDVQSHKTYVPFEEVMKLKRLQAKKSILVQVHSEQSCSQLHEYCLSFGSVKNILHYSLQPNMHFVIVEFDEEISTESVLRKSIHADNTQIIPVRSQFLWFKANDHKKQTKKVVHTSDQSPIKYGTVNPPSYEEISSWLLSHRDISEQMLLLYHASRLDDLGTRLRFMTAFQIENTLSGMFPFVRALPYGSTVNSFGKLNCDLDVVINLDFQPAEAIPDNRLIFQTKTSLVNNRSQQQRYIETISDLIERYLPGCCNVKRILLARVPILKFKQEYTGIECDLSLMNMTGVYMSELLHIFSSIDKRVCPLVYTIRYWAQVVNLTNPTPGRWITNFSLTLLVLFYLQQVNILPTLDRLIKLSKPEDRRFADDINCTFLRDISSFLKQPIENTSSLEELLKGFFDYFALFDFDSNAISLRLGKVIPKQEYSALYIVNPLESHLNVSKNVSPEELGRIRIEICNAARCLDRELSASDRDEKEWGLVTLFNSSHYNSKAKTVLYDTIQKKQQSLASSNRLVTITDLFSDEDESVGQISKQTVSHSVNILGQKRRKR